MENIAYLIKLLKCDSSNIRQIFQMNFFLHVNGPVFGIQILDSGSGYLFVKNLSPKLVVLKKLWLWDTLKDILTTLFSLQKRTSSHFLSQDPIFWELWYNQLSTWSFSGMTSSALKERVPKLKSAEVWSLTIEGVEGCGGAKGRVLISWQYTLNIGRSLFTILLQQVTLAWNVACTAWLPQGNQIGNRSK